MVRRGGKGGIGREGGWEVVGRVDGRGWDGSSGEGREEWEGKGKGRGEGGRGKGRAGGAFLQIRIYDYPWSLLISTVVMFHITTCFILASSLDLNIIFTLSL